MKYHTILCFFSTFLIQFYFSSCVTSYEEEDVEVIKIDIPNHNRQINLSSLTKNPQYVKLHTDSLFLIGDIRKIVYHGKIFVQNFKKIFVFNSDGSPSFVINNRGLAENEYYEINDFWVDTKKNQIEVWDKVKRRMFFFSLVNGDFIESQKWDLHAKYFKKSNGYYFFYSDEEYHKDANKPSVLYCIDEEGNIINKFFKSRVGNLYPFNTPEFLSVSNGDIYFDYAPFNTIYRITEWSIEAKYQLEINNSIVSEQEMLDMSGLREPDRYRKLFKNFYFSTGETKVGEFGLKVIINSKGERLICFIDTENNNYQIGRFLFDDFHLKQPVYYANICQNKLVSFIDSYKLVNSDQSYSHLAEHNPALFEVIKLSRQIDNPVLILSDLK